MDVFSRNTVLISAAAVTTAAIIYASYKCDIPGKLKRAKLGYNLQAVGKVKKLYIYPIKACRGISVTSAECTNTGLKHGVMRDRVFMIVTKEGHFLTSRQEPSLLLVTPSFHGNEMWVDAPNMSTLKLNLDDLQNIKDNTKKCRVWGQDVPGIYCGDEAAKWINSYLNKDDLYIVYHGSHLKPKYCAERAKYKPLVTKRDAAAYADFTCYMMMSKTSVDDLNRRLTKKVSMRRFRPNIVIQGSSAYDEDNWKYVRIGDDVWFRNVKPCQRCVMIVTDPNTGIRDEDEEALKVLRSYRKTTDMEMKRYVGDSCLLGINLGVDTFGEIRTGSWINVVRKEKTV